LDFLALAAIQFFRPAPRVARNPSCAPTVSANLFHVAAEAQCARTATLMVGYSPRPRKRCSSLCRARVHTGRCLGPRKPTATPIPILIPLLDSPIRNISWIGPRHSQESVEFSSEPTPVAADEGIYAANEHPRVETASATSHWSFTIK